MLVFAIAVGGGALYFFWKTPAPTHHVTSMPVLPPSPTPGIVAALPVATPWVSPDGAKTLVMKVTPEAHNLTSYVFTVKDSPDAPEQTVYQTNVESGVSMSIPFNSWSPDNQYFFILKKDGTDIHTLVFKASGKSFPDGSQFVDVNDAFVQKKIQYPFTEVTGWASPTLLVVNTKSPTSSAPISYWFDLSKKSFIRLTNSFQ